MARSRRPQLTERIVREPAACLGGVEQMPIDLPKTVETEPPLKIAVVCRFGRCLESRQASNTLVGDDTPGKVISDRMEVRIIEQFRCFSSESNRVERSSARIVPVDAARQMAGVLRSG